MYFELFWYETIDTNTLAFLIHIILAIVGVGMEGQSQKIWEKDKGYGLTLSLVSLPCVAMV